MEELKVKDEDLKKKDINSSSLQSACSSVHPVCTVDGVLAGLGLGCGDLLDGEPPAHDLLGDIDHLLLPDLDVQSILSWLSLPSLHCELSVLGKSIVQHLRVGSSRFHDFSRASLALF